MSRAVPAQRAVQWILAKGGPRLLGVATIVFGAAVLGVNVALIVGSGRYYGTIFILGMPLVTMGLWTLVTGKTNTPHASGPKPPLWWNIGFYALLVASVCYGLYLAIHLKKPGALDFWLGPAS